MPSANTIVPQQLEEPLVLPRNTFRIRTATRTFIVKPTNWLGKSAYFDQLFSNKWGDREADGSYFLDTNEAAFEIILEYLRTAVLPILYDNTKGHDVSLYRQVLHEAQYFCIDRLCRWITEAKYIDAVKIRTTINESDYIGTRYANGGPIFVASGRGYMEFSVRSDMEVTMVAIPQQKDVFRCPTGAHPSNNECIAGGYHRHQKSSELTTHLGGGWCKQDVVRYHITRKEVTFDHDLCVNAYPELK